MAGQQCPVISNMTYYGREAKNVLDNECGGWEELRPDESVSYNHTLCPAGEDRRRRLNVKNVGNTWLWHCFNCGESGYYRPKEVFSKLIEEDSVRHHIPIRESDAVSDYYAYDFRYEAFPTDQQLWLASYGFLREEVEWAKIRTSPRGVILPTYGPEGINGYQIRNFQKGVKYVTYTKAAVSTLLNVADVTVLCEDLLSGYKLCRAGYNSVALMGTKLKAPASTLPRTSRCIVWLDSDIAGTSGGIELMRNLSPLYETVDYIVNNQPKELTIEEIQNVIRH